ncbi:MAG: FG-GAP repeat domain-containing protein [Planctomycetota bacterium]
MTYPIGCNDPNVIEAAQIGRVRPQGNPEEGSFPVGPRTSMTLTREWMRRIYGVGIGAAGIQIANLDGDGFPELVCSAGLGGFDPPRFWYALRYIGTDLQHIYFSEIYTENIASLVIANVDSDDDLDIVVAVGTQVLAYDGSSFEIVSSFTAAAGTIRGIALRDIDGDGGTEIAAIGTAGLAIHDVITGSVEFLAPTLVGTDCAIGNVDTDSSLEIAIANGVNPLRVLDYETGQIQWTYNFTFGARVRVADVDGDGLDEIVAVRNQNRVLVLDADLQARKYEHISSSISRIDAFRLSDFDGDGVSEIVYGDQSGQMFLLRGTDGGELWQFWGGGIGRGHGPSRRRPRS